MQLYNNQTKMIPIATKTVLNSVPQFIKLEVSDVKLANTVRNLGVFIHLLSLSKSKSPLFVVYTIWKFVE